MGIRPIVPVAAMHEAAVHVQHKQGHEGFTIMVELLDTAKTVNPAPCYGEDFPKKMIWIKLCKVAAAPAESGAR